MQTIRLSGVNLELVSNTNIQVSKEIYDQKQQTTIVNQDGQDKRPNIVPSLKRRKVGCLERMVNYKPE